MMYNIRDKWLAICIFKKPVAKGNNFNVTGDTKWKVCGSKSVAQRCLNEWLKEGDTLLVRMIQVSELKRLISDYGMYDGPDSIKVVKELEGVDKELGTRAKTNGVTV